MNTTTTITTTTTTTNHNNRDKCLSPNDLPPCKVRTRPAIPPNPNNMNICMYTYIYIYIYIEHAIDNRIIVSATRGQPPKLS